MSHEPRHTDCGEVTWADAARAELEAGRWPAGINANGPRNLRVPSRGRLEAIRAELEAGAAGGPAAPGLERPGPGERPAGRTGK